MEITTSLNGKTPQPAMAFDPLHVLDGLVSTLESVESAIAGLQALREYTLAIASRLADVMAAEDMRDGGARDAGGVPAGFRGLRWDSAELAQRAVAAEIATATRANDRTIQRQMGQAVELLDRFPATFGALAQGRISLAHARVIQDAGTALNDPAALARYETVVVSCAEKQAPGRVRRLALREAEKAQPEPLPSRHERACEERRIWVTPLPDGMAELAAVLPAAVAYGVHDRLTRMAKAHADLATAQAEPARGAPGQPRTTRPTRSTDQLRADLLSELLLCGAPAGHDTPDGHLAAITARVDVTVPVLTLIGHEGSAAGGEDGDAGTFRTDASGTTARATAATTRSPADPGAANDHASSATPAIGAEKLSAEPAASQVPAELDGRHPIDPATARILAGQATGWNRVLTDPITGAVLAVDRYRPGEDLKRLLTARDSRCRFPGCGIKARELDLDHTHDAALGGPTDAGNLAGLCRRHHMLKHHSRWTTRQTGNGNLEWTSPTGRTYTDRPPIPATYTTPATGIPGPAPGTHMSGPVTGDAPCASTKPPPF